MKSFVNKIIRSLIQKAGFDIVPYRKNGFNSVYPPDFGAESIEIYETVKPYTMTTPERITALINAVNYLVKNKIDGALVECGVWKGGSSMAMALTLLRTGSEKRDLYLYDTYSGMSAPTDVDVSFSGVVAHQEFSKNKTSADSSNLYFSPLEEVKQNVYSTGYEKEKIHFIKGKVEEML